MHLAYASEPSEPAGERRSVALGGAAAANLGNVFLLGGQVREAVACYEESLRLRPGDARTRENLQLARVAPLSWSILLFIRHGSDTPKLASPGCSRPR